MTSLQELLNAKKAALKAASGKGGRLSEVLAKIPDGTSRWRIAESWRGAGQQFWHDLGRHFVKDSTGKLMAVYVCQDKTYGKPCAVCDAIAQGIAGATDDQTMELLKSAKSYARVLVNAVRLDGADAGKMFVLELPTTLFGTLIELVSEAIDNGQTLLGKDGLDIKIQRSGSGKNTEYQLMVAMGKPADIPAAVFDKVHNLDELITHETMEAQQRAINSVRAVSGLLPAPGTASPGLPSAARGGMSIDDDEPFVAPKAAAAGFAAAAAVSSGDDELDKLLAALG